MIVQKDRSGERIKSAKNGKKVNKVNGKKGICNINHAIEKKNGRLKNPVYYFNTLLVSYP